MNDAKEDILFDNFSEAADQWLENWHLLKNGCLQLSEGLKNIPANGHGEWEKIALTHIVTYHCGKCNTETMFRVHKLIVKRLLEDVCLKESKIEQKWYLNYKKQKKKRTSKAHLYAVS